MPCTVERPSPVRAGKITETYPKLGAVQSALAAGLKVRCPVTETGAVWLGPQVDATTGGGTRDRAPIFEIYLNGADILDAVVHVGHGAGDVERSGRRLVAGVH
jgi:hypothetical protein